MNNSSKPKLVKIGVIKGAKGLQGELKVHLFSGEASWLGQIKNIFLHNLKEPNPKEYKIGRAQVLDSTLLLKLPEIKSREGADVVKGWEVLVPEHLFDTVKGEAIFLREILGFEVFNNGVLVGVIADFSSNGLQDLLIVKREKGEVLIPLVKNFLIEINHPKRQVLMSLPEGLIEINDAL